MTPYFKFNFVVRMLPLYKIFYRVQRKVTERNEGYPPEKEGSVCRVNIRQKVIDQPTSCIKLMSGVDYRSI